MIYIDTLKENTFAYEKTNKENNKLGPFKVQRVQCSLGFGQGVWALGLGFGTGGSPYLGEAQGKIPTTHTVAGESRSRVGGSPSTSIISTQKPDLEGQVK